VVLVEVRVVVSVLQSSDVVEGWWWRNLVVLCVGWMVVVDLGGCGVCAWCVVVDIVECGVGLWYMVSGCGVGDVWVGIVAILAGVDIDGGVLGGGSMCGGGGCGGGCVVETGVWCRLLLLVSPILPESSFYLAKFCFH
jgi:hypothetical protein